MGRTPSTRTIAREQFDSAQADPLPQQQEETDAVNHDTNEVVTLDEATPIHATIPAATSPSSPCPTKRVIPKQRSVTEIAEDLQHSGIAVVDYAYINPRISASSSRPPSTPRTDPPSVDYPTLPPPTFSHMHAKTYLGVYDYYLSQGSADGGESDDDDMTEVATIVGDSSSFAGSCSGIIEFNRHVQSRFCLGIYPVVFSTQVFSPPPSSMPRPEPEPEPEPESPTKTRVHAIPGMITHRLLEIEWITERDVQKKLLPIDREALDAHRVLMKKFSSDLEKRVAEYNAQLFRDLRSDATDGKVDMKKFQRLVEEKSKKVLRFGLRGKGEYGYPYHVDFKSNPRRVKENFEWRKLPEDKRPKPEWIPRFLEKEETPNLGVGRPPTRIYRDYLRKFHALDMEQWFLAFDEYERGRMGVVKGDGEEEDDEVDDVEVETDDPLDMLLDDMEEAAMDIDPQPENFHNPTQVVDRQLPVPPTFLDSPTPPCSPVKDRLKDRRRALLPRKIRGRPVPTMKLTENRKGAEVPKRVNDALTLAELENRSYPPVNTPNRSPNPGPSDRSPRRPARRWAPVVLDDSSTVFKPRRRKDLRVEADAAEDSRDPLDFVVVLPSRENTPTNERTQNMRKKGKAKAISETKDEPPAPVPAPGPSRQRRQAPARRQPPVIVEDSSASWFKYPKRTTAKALEESRDPLDSSVNPSNPETVPAGPATRKRRLPRLPPAPLTMVLRERKAPEAASIEEDDPRPVKRRRVMKEKEQSASGGARRGSSKARASGNGRGRATKTRKG
ncbi:hypothetical protein AAF712_006222 [Marasmius tenuissimus]|uniref:Uncharacterized protein n=1 Tax=Marasmius tenuissimus TaxID=585030 RepID=A0ABR2ZZQ9_9AGAR